MKRFVIFCLFCCWTLATAGSAAHAQITPAPRATTPTRSTYQSPQRTNGAANSATNANAGNELAAQILNYERTQNSDGLLLAYGQAVTDASLARAAISQLLSSYYLLRNQAQTAEQATQAVGEANLRFQVLQAAQNQVLIQQNQQILAQNAQIIALLRDNQKAATTR